jgi:dihydrodipicolinate synthase/N-acetylneuraminate lyase
MVVGGQRMRIEITTLGGPDEAARGSLVLEDGGLDETARELDLLGSPPRVDPVRLAYAATHLVMLDAYEDTRHRFDDPGTPDEIVDAIDWKATENLRRHIASEGFGIAEAMDTAQRFSLGWNGARRLIEMCGALHLPRGFVAGAGSDCAPDSDDAGSLAEAVAFEAEFIRSAGGIPVILPLPWLSLNDHDADETVALYRDIIERCEGPLYIHWLGAMFLPSLEGYFPGDSFERVMDLDHEKIRGAKISLLDARREKEIRTALAPAGQFVLTGDDLHFSSLIAGEGEDPGQFSHALLGILAAITRPAGLALRFLDHGDRDRFRAIMDPCEELARIVFEAPTQHYKAGLAFLAWVNGHQPNPLLANREDLCRDRDHYLRVLRAASRCGAITDAAGASQRLLSWMD